MDQVRGLGYEKKMDEGVQIVSVTLNFETLYSFYLPK